MSQRERPRSPGVAHAPSPPANPALPTSPRNGDLSSASEWRAVFQSLTLSQQQSLLDLAARQGFVFGNQVPKQQSGSERVQSIISALLQGTTGDLVAPACIEPINAIDSSLDAWQLDAVAKAIHTTDLCLIQGRAGSGKSRVIAEIIGQAVGRGKRVLFTAPHAAALDVVLSRIANESGILVLRCLGRDEGADRLPPASANCTVSAHRQRLTNVAAGQVRHSLDERTARIERARAELPAIERVRDLLQRKHDLEIALAAACPMPAESDAFPRELAADQVKHEANLRRLDEAIQVGEAELQAVQKRIADLDSQLTAGEQAVANRGWLAKLFHFSAGRETIDARQLRAQLDELRTSESQAKRFAEQSAIERQQLVAQWETVVRRRTEEESAQRQVEHEKRRRELALELNRLMPEIGQAWSVLPASSGLTEATDLNTIVDICESKRKSLEEDEREAEFARRWSQYLAENTERIGSQLWSCAHVVAAPLDVLANEASLAELTHSGPFDLMILDEADRVSESQWIAALSCAQRWVLVGESVVDIGDKDVKQNGKDREEQGGNGRRSGNSPRLSGPPRSSPWPRLWKQLQADSWRVEGDRLCARLLPIAEAHRCELESEPVADSPEVELRIWTPAGGTPALAEVRFPSSTPVRQALLFLHNELGEIPVGAGPMCWSEKDGRLICQLLPPTPKLNESLNSKTESVELEPGLKSRLASEDGGWRLASIEFDMASGWTRGRAEAWVRTSLHVADFGRTARLPTVHRPDAALAVFHSIVGLGSAKLDLLGSGHVPAVEFIPVPALTNEPQARRRGDVGLSGQQRRLPPLRGGAGLEIDLADARQRERLPAELQSRLPARGLVNISEAEAVVRLLENLIDDLPTGSAERPISIAAIPLYEAQAELLRGLVVQSAVLSAARVPVQIASPRHFRQREADVVLIGLTRSHSHRAVSYGEESESMALALTRARRRIVLVGDPGTLARRAQWDGPLEHLDEAASRREKDWVAALVRQLQGLGVSTVQLREGPP